jgi:hypothetical protein
MFYAIALIALGLLAVLRQVLRPDTFARQRTRDRRMPWFGNYAANGWTRKAFAALPLPVDFAVQLVVGLAMIAGGIFWLISR